MFETEQSIIENKIKQFCAENDIPVDPEIKWSNIPFSGEWGISTSFFQTAANEAKQGKKVIVPQRANEIAELLVIEMGIPTGFSRVEAVKGYLNLYFKTGDYAKRVIDEVIEKKEFFGKGADKGEGALVEFSQPNTHKAFHIGHLRSMIFGAALSNIHEFAGYRVVRANYIGDTGLHVIKWLWNFEKSHSGEEPPPGETTRWMGDIYAESSRKLDEDPALEEEIKQTFVRWDARDPALMQLWEKTRQWSLDGFMEIYGKMGVLFDRIYFQSEEDTRGKQIVNELIEREIAEDERPEGPVIVRIDDKLGLDKEKYRVAVILRSDSTALYATWDMSLALKKYEEYDLTHSYYVVDVRQSMHFSQVFKILEIAGYTKQAAICEHVPYEIVNLPGNVTMKSREGTVVLLEDLMKEAINRAEEIAAERNASLNETQRKEVGEAVGLAAIKFPLLARDNTKIATFDWDAALDFNGQAAPYIQYAHVRCSSLIRKQDGIVPEPIMPDYELDPSEIQLIELLASFPNVVQTASKENKTLHITNLGYELARSFNNFYNQCPVLKAESGVLEFRLRIVAATRQAIANCLNLLTISAPDVM
ncbi:MAG: arginine--tRNA ligase [Anaerolineales bacterium]|nr:arginine--tRNA ligase [Anaerolineales bacterium]